MSYSHLNQPQVVSSIDKLVRDVLYNKISFDHTKEQLNSLYSPLMAIFDFDLCYSVPVNAFIQSTHAIVGDSYPSDVIWGHENTRRLINILSCYKDDVENEYNAWRYQESQNRNSLESYVRDLSSHYSKLLFIRIDLKYLYEISHLVTIDIFNDHMNKIRELISNKKTCFKELQGYAWALEQGYENGGLHCHLLLIYNGSEKKKDFHIAKEVGEKWKEVTEGLGGYYNYHDTETKSKYHRHGKLGIGMIRRSRLQKVENAVRSALYLTEPNKNQQQLKLWLPNMRTFGHGTYRNTKRRGLPPRTK